MPPKYGRLTDSSGLSVESGTGFSQSQEGLLGSARLTPHLVPESLAELPIPHTSSV